MITLLHRARRYTAKFCTKQLIQVEYRACPICGSDSLPVFRRNDQHGFPIHLSECSDCGLLYQNPFPTKAFLDYFYQSGMYHWLHGLHKEHSLENKGHDEYMDRENIASLKANGFDTTKALLDFGAGNGQLVRAVHAAFPGCTADGIEPNATFFDDQNSDTLYDIIVSVDVFEHLYDPVKTLTSLATRLKKGGKIILEVPSLPLYEEIGAKAVQLAHVLYFDKPSVTRLLALAGFSPPTWDTTTIHPYCLRAVAELL